MGSMWSLGAPLAEAVRVALEPAAGAVVMGSVALITSCPNVRAAPSEEGVVFITILERYNTHKLRFIVHLSRSESGARWRQDRTQRWGAKRGSNRNDRWRWPFFRVQCRRIQRRNLPHNQHCEDKRCVQRCICQQPKGRFDKRRGQDPWYLRPSGVPKVNKSEEDLGCFVCWIMTHGVNGAIKGADGQEINLNRLPGILNTPSLKGKPKLFFIQACQADETETSTRHWGCNIPTYPDFLFSFATTPGYCQTSGWKQTQHIYYCTADVTTLHATPSKDA
ncbi:uncharacterized protein LOC135371085 isoform X4 [Ornithodoros turicata]|uniref:uncharacterized protein LOC135371085 isoform X4 n=1 Tax=Ornithodoros turicata TaxID=34597 RepID=UPI003139C937